MNYFKKLPNSVREAPGLEWTVLKKLPLTVLLGTLFPLILSLVNRVIPPEGTADQIAKHIKSVDIIAIATAVTVWTAVLTDDFFPAGLVTATTWPGFMLRCRERFRMQKQPLPENP